MKLTGINYNWQAQKLRARDISAPVRAAGAEAAAAGAWAGAAGAEALAAGAQAGAARQIASVWEKTGRDITKASMDVYDEEAAAQMMDAQSAHKVQQKELFEAQNRVDTETGEPSWKSLDNYGKNQGDISEGIGSDITNPKAKEAFGNWSTEQNDASMMSHMQRADGWRREDNAASAQKSIDTKLKAGNFDAAHADLVLAGETGIFAPGQANQIKNRIDMESTLFTHNQTTDVLVGTGNVKALDQHMEQMSNDLSLKPSQRKQLRSEAVAQFSESLVTTYTDRINGTVERGGLAAGVKHAEDLFNKQLGVNTSEYPGGEETHERVLSDLRTRRSYYRSLLEKNQGFSNTSLRLFGVENGDYKAAPNNDFNKDVTDVVAIKFRGHALDGKKVEMTPNSRTDAQILETPEQSAQDYMNLKVIRNQGYADSWLKGLGEGVFDVDKSEKEQANGLAMLARIDDINGTFLTTSKFSDDTLEYVSLAKHLGPEAATKMIRQWRDAGSPPPPSTFNTDFADAYDPDGFVQMQRDWWPDKDVTLNLRDTSEVKRLAGKYYSMFGNINKAVEYAAKSVASKKIGTNMSSVPTSIDAGQSVEAHPQVTRLAKDSGYLATEITGELKEQVDFDGYDADVSPVSVTVNPAAPNDNGQILVNVTGFDKELGYVTSSPQMIDLVNTKANEKAIENDTAREAEVKKSMDANQAIQGLSALEQDQGMRIDAYVLGTSTQDKLEQMGFDEQAIRDYLDYKLKYRHQGMLKAFQGRRKIPETRQEVMSAPNYMLNR